MELGIAGRKAVVCASSQGLGRACAEALSAEGVDVVINGRDAAKLERTATEIRAATGGVVTPVAADITTDEGRDALLAACPEPDIVVLNNRGPKPGALGEITDDDLQLALDLHFWTPIKILQRVVPGMCERGFGRIVSITSAMVTTPRPSMLASTGARDRSYGGPEGGRGRCRQVRRDHQLSAARAHRFTAPARDGEPRRRA